LVDLSFFIFFSPDSSGIPRFLAWIQRIAGIASKNSVSKVLKIDLIQLKFDLLPFLITPP
jgi:hypothetical protein